MILNSPDASVKTFLLQLCLLSVALAAVG